MNDSIILIGPIGVGKTTVSKILSEKTGLKVCHVDDIRNTYFLKIGYSRVLAFFKLIFKGEMTLYRYWKRFEVNSLENIIDDHPHHILDFGAGFSVYENEEYLEKAREVFSKQKNVVLLKPVEDNNASFEYLKARTDSHLNELFIFNPSNELLANHVIFTKDKTPDQVANDVLSAIE